MEYKKIIYNDSEQPERISKKLFARYLVTTRKQLPHEHIELIDTEELFLAENNMALVLSGEKLFLFHKNEVKTAGIIPDENGFTIKNSQLRKILKEVLSGRELNFAVPVSARIYSVTVKSDEYEAEVIEKIYIKPPLYAYEISGKDENMVNDVSAALGGLGYRTVTFSEFYINLLKSQITEQNKQDIDEIYAEFIEDGRPSKLKKLRVALRKRCVSETDKKTLKIIKKIRKLTAKAREYDVFIKFIKKYDFGGKEELNKYLADKRAKEVLKLQQKMQDKAPFFAELADASGAAEEAGGVMLKKTAKKLQKAASKAIKKPCAANWHNLRLKIKILRYQAEYAGGLDEAFIKALKAAQTHLGRLNDLYAVKKLIRKSSKKLFFDKWALKVYVTEGINKKIEETDEIINNINKSILQLL